MEIEQPEVVAGAPAETQRRGKQRQRVLKAAKIVLDHSNTIDCTMRDVSETGAKLKLLKSCDVPDKFRLHVVVDNTIRDAEKSWQRDDLVGVVFTSPTKPCALRKF